MRVEISLKNRKPYENRPLDLLESDKDFEDFNKWIEALRSGDYNQGNGMLFRPDNNTFCCLGVACNVMEYKRSEMEHFLMPLSIGLNPKHGLYNFLSNERMCDMLADFNDTGSTFKEIAEYLEGYVAFVKERNR